jgi:protein tyrosine/serine phosphatase
MKQLSSAVKRNLIITVMIVVVIFGIGWYRFVLPENFHSVREGILYRSGQGKGFELKNAVRQTNIKTIICVRDVEPTDDARWLDVEQNVCRELNVEFIRYPLDSHHLPSDSYLIEFLNLVQDPSRTPILLHCAQGKHRTGFFIALYRLVIENWSKEEALKEMELYGFDLSTHLELVNGIKNLDVQKLKRGMKQ